MAEIGAWARLVNSDVSDELLSLCNEALIEIQSETRLRTLREVRKIAIGMDMDPANDPYLWGYGGREICRMLGDKVREARGE